MASLTKVTETRRHARDKKKLKNRHRKLRRAHARAKKANK